MIDGIVSPLWIRDIDELVTLAMCASAFCSVVLAAAYSRSRKTLWLMRFEMGLLRSSR